MGAGRRRRQGRLRGLLAPDRGRGRSLPGRIRAQRPARRRKFRASVVRGIRRAGRTRRFGGLVDPDRQRVDDQERRIYAHLRAHGQQRRQLHRRPGRHRRRRRDLPHAVPADRGGRRGRRTGFRRRGAGRLRQRRTAVPKPRKRSTPAAGQGRHPAAGRRIAQHRLQGRTAARDLQALPPRQRSRIPGLQGAVVQRILGPAAQHRQRPAKRRSPGNTCSTRSRPARWSSNPPN